MGIKPHEFYDSTYKDIQDYVRYYSLQREEDLKINIQLLEALGNKMAGVMPLVNKKPKNMSLIQDVYSDLFKEELEKLNEKENQPQSVEEMISNMRTWGSRNSKPKN